jgi:hypothetical protein
MLFSVTGVAVAASGFLLLCLTATAAHADVWVFEPAIAIDQRFDDNYRIRPQRSSTVNPDTGEVVVDVEHQAKEPVNATRIVGSLGLSRESAKTVIKGIARIDGLLTESKAESVSDGLSSNQLLFLDYTFNDVRTTYGIGFDFTQDSPSRDISADITDEGVTASDTGASTTQGTAVNRQRYALNPNWRYELTRRATLDADVIYTQVDHDLASVDDLKLDRFLSIPEGTRPETPDDLGPFRVGNELDGYNETALKLGVRYKLSPISTLTFSAGYSDYHTDIEIDAADFVAIPFNAEIPDPRDPDIRRLPRRERQASTSTFRLGYERAFSQTLTIGLELGVFETITDNTDLYQESDESVDEPDRLLLSDTGRMNLLEEGEAKEQGYLTKLTVRKDTDITRYSLKMGVDVLPSDVGSQVEALEVIGDMVREIGPLLDFSFRVRAYEPDSFNSSNDDEFKRRFLSLEPRLIWRYTRAWTLAAAYRYRRQKSQTRLESGESNALLFSLKYTPPSAIRDAELNN